MIKNIINLLSKIFRRKSLHKDSFDVNIKSQDKLKEIFGVDKDMKYGDFSAQTKESLPIKIAQKMREARSQHLLRSSEVAAKQLRVFKAATPHAEEVEKRDQLKKLLETISKDPDRL